jgi:hypothetical protein
MRRKTRADLRLHEKATILEIGEKGLKAAGEVKTAFLLEDRDIEARNTVFGIRSPQPKLQRQANNRIRIFFPRHWEGGNPPDS